MPLDSSFVWQPPPFDWKDVAGSSVREFRRRVEMLARLEADPTLLPSLRVFYRANPVAFICDWGCTYDPRNVDVGLPTLQPFVLFERQIDAAEYIVRKWKERRNGLAKKSRDVGFTWLAIALSCTLCIFYDGMRIGFGSRKAEYVDTLNDPKAILPKGREFMRHLPRQFRAGWTLKDHAPHMKLIFPDTGSTIGGEAGSSIGRGDRTAIYFVDEYAHFEPGDARGSESALSMTTNCRVDASSVNGMNNAFAEKYHGGKIETFDFLWSDDPRKDRAWYEEKREAMDPVVFAQEVDCDFHASTEGVVIPAEWVAAALDAHIKLGVIPKGEAWGALDVADEGRDQNALVGGQGILVDTALEHSGVGSDIAATVAWVASECDVRGWRRIRYDADGMGAAVRGDARVVNEERKRRNRAQVDFQAYRGSGEIQDPKDKVDGMGGPHDVEAPTNEDYFQNAKAQAWWDARRRFERTWRAVTRAEKFDPDKIISISSAMPLHRKLMAELSQPTRTFSVATGRMLVDKTPEGSASPNLADGVVIRYARAASQRIVIPGSLMSRV